MSIADLHDVRSFPSYAAPQRRRYGAIAAAGFVALALGGVLLQTGLVSAEPKAAPVLKPTIAATTPAPAPAVTPVAAAEPVASDAPAPRKVRVIPLYNIPGPAKG